MTQPQWYSQRFRADGGVPAEGLRNQLGRPNLSLLTLLVRESAQNSWDARTDDVVDYRIDLGNVNVPNLPSWRGLLASGIPSVSDDTFPLRQQLKKPSMTYLAVSDRGTTGLGGPTRSDQATGPGENRNWLSFVLNSGDQKDVGGGGTYGYGKGAFFLASKVGTILILTRFRDDDGELHTRLIGSAMVTSFDLDGAPYTGRHWWGIPSDDHCAPLEDDQAESVAIALGLPGFRGGRTGTTVVVIDPDLTDPATPDDDAASLRLAEAARYLADAAAWNLWPLMLKDRTRRMSVTVTGAGSKVRVPDEDDHPVLSAFSDAYRASLGAGAERLTALKSKRPVGAVAHMDTFGARIDSPAAGELGLDGSPHHFALMRRPDLVVAYFEGPTKAHPDVGYAGVFKVDDSLNDVFASAEPPTHDAWVDSQLKGQDATFVRVARRRLKDLSAEIAGARISSAQAKAVAVGSLSQRLGHLVSGPGAVGAVLGTPAVRSAAATTGGGFAGDGGKGGGAGSGGTTGSAAGSRRRRPSLVGDPVFEILWDQYVVRQRISITEPGSYKVRCEVVTGEGGHESEHPVGAEQPVVLGWRHGSLIRRGDLLTAAELGEYDALVIPPADVVFDIFVDAAE